MSRPEGLPLQALLTAQGLAPPDDPVLASLRRVLKRAARKAAARDAARADLPAPLPAASAFPEGRLSPRMLVLLARALDTHRGMRVALVGDPLAALAAVLADAGGGRRPLHVSLHTMKEQRARLTLERLLPASRLERVEVIDQDGSPSGGPLDADRILMWRPHITTEEPVRPSGEGTVLQVEAHGARPSIVQTAHVGGELARMDLGGLDPSRVGGTEAQEGQATHPRLRWGRAPDSAPIRRLLLVERMQQNAWRGHAPSRIEAGVSFAVKRLFADAPAPPAGTASHALARILLHLGYLEQVTATRRGAEALYLASLDACHTAEGWTFLGWARAQQGRLEDASAACEEAIRTDPTLGNPYNDLGAYRLSEGRRSEAKKWFLRATRAPRYMAPHYPYTNLARIHYEEGDLESAREAAEEALAHMPGYRPAERLLKMLDEREDGGAH